MHFSFLVQRFQNCGVSEELRLWQKEQPLDLYDEWNLRELNRRVGNASHGRCLGHKHAPTPDSGQFN